LPAAVPESVALERYPGRCPRLSAAQRAALKLQDKYMGTMRGLKPRQRAKIKKIRAAKGFVAAIKAAERMAAWAACSGMLKSLWDA